HGDRAGEDHPRHDRGARDRAARSGRPGGPGRRRPARRRPDDTGGPQVMTSSGVPANRSPEQIRASIEQTRRELAVSVDDLRGKVAEIADWRRQLAENRNAALTTAAVA